MGGIKMYAVIQWVCTKKCAKQILGHLKDADEMFWDMRRDILCIKEDGCDKLIFPNDCIKFV